MAPFRNALFSQTYSRPAKYLGKVPDNGAGYTPAYFGAKAGDIIIARAANSAGSTTTPAINGSYDGWSDLDYGFKWRTVVDINQPMTVPSGYVVQAALYNGPFSFVKRAYAESNINEGDTVPGFIKSPNHAGIFVLQETYGVKGTSSNVVSPPTFRRRIEQSAGTYTSGFDTESYDRLQPDSSEYQNNTNIGWVPGVASPDHNAVISIYEFLNK